jgi:hypothetical protein
MDGIPAQRHVRRLYVCHNRYTPPVPKHFTFNAAQPRPSRRRRLCTAALRAQAAELRSAKANLERAYNKERNVHSLSSRCTGVTFNFPKISAARARGERRYVNFLIRYLRGTNQMSAVEAAEMQRNFTRRKTEAMGMRNRAYLLAMYPWELK